MARPDRADGPDGRDVGSRHHARMSGVVSDVVQAGQVHGGVHFHGERPADVVPRQLPGDVSGFVDRAGELRQLDAVLSAGRPDDLVVGVYAITGTAGVGKTSLALHWAHSVRHHFPGGQLYVNLRGYDPGPQVTAEQALDRFLRALGVAPPAVPRELEDRAALYRSLLADRRVLVVLDNAASTRQVRPLLPGNPECLVLVTSRGRLSGLVARDGARRLEIGVLPEAEAVNLVRTITAPYRGADDSAVLHELAALCARLPLALRIAAERAASRPLMHLDELIADLRDESALWDALTADDDEEADAVRTVFAWSYRALPEPAARLFRLLGLHPGPEFSVQAVAALADTTVSGARNLLDVLVGAHVLEQHAVGRYQFHDLLRIYATEQAAREETAEGRRAALTRVITWYAHAAQAAATAFAPHGEHLPPLASAPPVSFATAADAMRWHDEERVNLVAAVRAAAAADLPELACRIPLVLRPIHARQNLFDDWITTTEIGLASARRLGDLPGEGRLLDSLGKAHLQCQRFDLAERCHRDALAIRRELGDRLGEATTINALGLLDWRRRRLPEAVGRFETALALVRDLGDRRWQALLLTNLGMARLDLDELEPARTALTDATELCREVGDRAYLGNALSYLAAAQRELGHLDQALRSIESALVIARDDRLRAWEAYWLLELARVQRALGRADDALTSYQASAVVQRQLGDRGREAMALDGTGEAYRELGRPADAEGFHRLAVATFRETGDRWHLAVALANLAAAVHQVAGPDQARPHREEAAAVLADATDPRAVRLRERVLAGS